MTRLAHRILCIEDDERLRRLVAEDLREAGYTVHTAHDARSGQRAFFEHAPALVLCDVRMPRVSGFDLIERLRRLDVALFGVAFIFLTALADREHQLRGRRLGADDYMTKPIDYEILREIVRIRLSGRKPTPTPGPMDPSSGRVLDTWFDCFTPAAPMPPADVLRARFGSGRRMPTDAESGLFEAMARGSPLGVVIVDGAGLLRYVNESASGMLGRPRADLAGSRAPPHVLHFARSHAGSERAKCGGFSASRIALEGSAGTVTAIARCLQGGQGADASVAIVMPVLLPSSPASPGLLRTLFDLTPAEELVAEQIAAGTNLADVAASRGVSLATVRTQLKTVFGKMGVTRQTELVRALLSLQVAAGFTDSGE